MRAQIGRTATYIPIYQESQICTELASLAMKYYFSIIILQVQGIWQYSVRAIVQVLDLHVVILLNDSRSNWLVIT